MKNMGSIDRILRIVVGIAVLGAGFYFNNWWGAIGAVPLITALIGWCPLYTILGIKTCPTTK